eukprot:TRINITY_DN721_c0_g1_i6.p1 TRINITY_DN721_c0_g1~~TRINITY_DN721_c0_g1_i6.p1  ORF type:complete len:204 (+),score=58.63 TRINITY_DN721_c0_g1_i6:461-1072(+)
MEEAESAEDVLPPESSSFEVNPSEEIEHVLRTLNLHDSEMTDEVPSCSLDKVVLQRIVFSGLKNRFFRFLKDRYVLALTNVLLTPTLLPKFLATDSVLDDPEALSQKVTKLLQAAVEVFNKCFKSMPSFFASDCDENEASIVQKNERTKRTEDEEDFAILGALGESVGRNEKVNHESSLRSQIEEYLSVVSYIGKKASDSPAE